MMFGSWDMVHYRWKDRQKDGPMENVTYRGVSSKNRNKKKKKNKKLVATLGFECWTSFPKSAPAKFSGHKSCESRDVKFSNCQTTSQWSYNQRVMWIYGWEFFMVCCHLEKFCGHRHCDSEDMYLLFHKNSEDNLIDGSC